MFSWIAGVDALSPIALTALAQTVDPNDPPDQLLYPSFFRDNPVDSIRLANITGSIDFRPVADRREWGQRGRLIPLKQPDLSRVEMIPIECYYKVGEHEIQLLTERTLGDAGLFRRIVGTEITQRTPGLAASNFRRLELDAFTAWALGQITVHDPQGGAADKTTTLGFANDRYVDESTPGWDDAGVNAYDKLMTHAQVAIQKIGSCGGSMLRLKTLLEIRKDAPRPVNAANVELTLAELQGRAQADLGRPFRFLLNEQTMDRFSDGGISTAKVNKWPAGLVGFLPDDFRIGSIARAPVARAFELVGGRPDGGIVDVRGNTVYHEIAGNGRELTVECQLNALPLPEEQRVYVVNSGIT
jgi:hypothetical protein